jgi:hypothetical protein
MKIKENQDIHVTFVVGVEVDALAMSLDGK